MTVGKEKILDLIKEKIEEIKTAPKEGAFSRDYLQGQAEGMLTALSVIEILTDKEYEAIAVQIFK